MARLNKIKEEDLSSALAALQISMKKPVSNPSDAGQTGNGLRCGNDDSSPVRRSNKTGKHQQRQQVTPQRKALKSISHNALGAGHLHCLSEARPQSPSRSPPLLEVWRAAGSSRGLRAADGTVLSLDVEHTCFEPLDESIGSLEDFIVDDSHVSYEDSASDPDDITAECPGRAGFCPRKQPQGAREKFLDALIRYREEREERSRQRREREEGSRGISHPNDTFIGRASSSYNVPGVGEDVPSRWHQPPELASENPSPDSRDDSLRISRLPPVLKYKTTTPKTELLIATGQTNPHLGHNPAYSSSPASSSGWSPTPSCRDRGGSARLLFPSTTSPAEDNEPKTSIVLPRSIGGQPSDELEARVTAALPEPTMALRQNGELSFEETKHHMATEFFSLLDRKISRGRIAARTAGVGGVPIRWNNRMITTAGWAITRRDPDLNVRKLFVELASRLITDEKRLKDTLAHEYCHVAARIVDRDRSRRHHGRAFKKWAKLVDRHFGIKIETYHKYPTRRRRTKNAYAWRCIDHGHVIQRHRPYFDPNRHLCPSCRSNIVQIRPPPENGPVQWVPEPRRDRRGRWLRRSLQPRHAVAEVGIKPEAAEDEEKKANIADGEMVPVGVGRKRKRGSSRNRRRKRRSRHNLHDDEPLIGLGDSDNYE